MNTRMDVTAYMMIENLGSGLYDSPGQCVMELVRNGLVASMPDAKNRWEPQLANIEISLVPNHPLGGKAPTLVVLDHGCGLTDPMLDRYFKRLGTSIHDLNQQTKMQSNGASQKGIGRLAALALNSNCVSDKNPATKRIKHGYYLLSRTSVTGDARFVSMIPEKYELEGGFRTDRFIPSDSTEMGHLKKIKGPFTAIVIPTPVFSSCDDICEAIKWLLPRERDKMFPLTVGSKTLEPPPLESAVNVTSENGLYRARLGVGDADSGGVWLCDEGTGLRVASCRVLGRLLPDPLWFPDLKGDIFAPGLLRHQNTARNTLAKDFMKKGNREWDKLMMFLIGSVVQGAKQLIERDAISGDAAATLDEVVEMVNTTFGEPEEIVAPGFADSNKPGVKQKQGEGSKADPKGHRKPATYQRYVSIKVRDETYVLYRGQSIDPFVFAQVSANNPNQVIVNVRGGYKALPSTKEARREHCLVQILFAIGQGKFPGDSYQATLFANEVRAELMKK
jgi:hypothetical protein